MPAAKHREGDDLAKWEATKERRLQRMALARERAKSLSGHTLVLFHEAAAMLSLDTVKSLRQNERESLARGEYWPPRVEINSRIVGYRLVDLEAFIDSRLVVPAEATNDE